MSGAWSFERSGWGGNKYITPELLREYGIGSGFFRDPEGARNLGWDLEGYAPWAANRTAYDTALSELDSVRKQIETHPTRGKTDSYNKLKGLTESYSNLHTKISDYRKQAKSLEEAYTKDWLSKHHISYDPTREAGTGRYWWDQSKVGQQRRDISDTPIDPWNAGHWYQDSSGKSKWITGRTQGQRYTDLGFAPERDEYTAKALDRFLKLPDRMVMGTRGASHDRGGRSAQEFYEDAGYGSGKMWDDPYWGGLWYDYVKPGRETEWEEQVQSRKYGEIRDKRSMRRDEWEKNRYIPRSPTDFGPSDKSLFDWSSWGREKDPSVDKTTTANEYGSTTVDPMPNMDWFTEAPRGAEGVATQRGLTGSRKKDSKYGKSFRRGDRDNSLTTSSLNI